jgi:16S rRNA processing protein RimM
VVNTRFVLGLVGAPFGVKGFVKIRSLSGEYAHLERLGVVTLRRGDDERGWEVEAAMPLTQAVAMKFKGIDSPEDAKALVGAELLGEREQAAPLAPDEWYVEDLRGIEVRLTDGTLVGAINDVVEGGGGQLAELRLLTGECKFLPFRKEFLAGIDLASRSATLLAPWVLE